MPSYFYITALAIAANCEVNQQMEDRPTDRPTNLSLPLPLPLFCVTMTFK